MLTHLDLAKAVNARRSHHCHRFYSHTVLLGRTERVNERKQTYTTHKAVLIGYTDKDCGDWDIILESADHWQPIQAIEDLWSKTQGRMDEILGKSSLVIEAVLNVLLCSEDEEAGHQGV
jgi:hypothetical protein